MPLWLDGWAVQEKRTKEPELPEEKKNLNTELKRLYLKVASKGNPMVKRGELGLSGLGVLHVHSLFLKSRQLYIDSPSEEARRQCQGP